MLDLLKEYSSIPAISGREEPIRQLILQKIKSYADKIDIDPMGNILVFKKGKNTPKVKLMIDAHMDEIGFFITGITDDGNLRFEKVGGIDDKVIFGRRVVIGNIKGVIGGNAIHNLDGDKRKAVVPASDLYIDIGADSKEGAESLVKIGDCAVFDTEFIDMGEKFSARAIDDRVGCAVLTKMIQSDLDYDMYFTFTTQEELGLRGAKCAAHTINPDYSLVIEATTASDIEGTPDDKTVCKVGSGAVLSFMDGATVYDKILFDFALTLGKDKNIPVQIKTAVAGGNNAGSINVSNSGVKTLAISLPCRYIHSAYGVASKSDLKAVADLTSEMALAICKGEIS